MILIGSRAAKFWSYAARNPNKDWDIIASEKEIFDFLNRHKDEIVHSYPSSPTKLQVLLKDHTKIEFESTAIPSNQIIVEDMNASTDLSRGSYVTFHDEKLKVCPAIFLMLMKRSLLYWSVHWKKTIDDYHYIRRFINPADYRDNSDRVERGFPNFISENERKFFNLRVQENETKFGKKNISLNMDEKKFFNRSSKIRTMDHDVLHSKVMFYDAPLYTEVKLEETKPLLSKEKFEKDFTFDDRIKLAQEECLAIAFERIYIPNLLDKKEVNIKEFYAESIRLVTAKLTKGWFCDYVIDHYDHVLNISENHLKNCEDKIAAYFESQETV